MNRRIISLVLCVLMLVVLIPAKKAHAESTYFWPVRGTNTVITQDFHSTHDALDIVGGTQYIIAAKAGTVIVVYSGCNNAGNYGNITCKDRGICSPNHGYSSGYCNWGYGRGVIIRHADGSGYSQYAHMSNVEVSEGSYVSAGQQLGKMGNYGMSTGTHLHFALTKTVSTEDKNDYIRFTSPINPYDVDYSFTDNSGRTVGGNPVYFDGFVTNGAGKSFYVSGNNAMLVCNLKSANTSFPLNRPAYGTRKAIVKTIGVELFRNGTYVAGKQEIPTAGTDVIQIWYDVNSELGYTLTDGYYTYRFYADIGTKRFYSEMRSFTFGNPQSVSVSFNPVGGTVSPTNKTVYYGSTYGELPVPEKSGYEFTGWKDINGNVITSATIVGNSSDHALHATWKKTGITVSFDVNGGNSPVPEQIYALGSVYGDLPVPSRKGYSFTGWHDGEKTVTKDTGVPDVNITLKAQWKAKEYTVIFDANNSATGGNLETDSMKVTFNGKYGPLPTVTRNGATFLGWYTKAADGTPVTEDTVVTTPSDHTLYAYWNINTYKVFLDANGGEVDKKYHEAVYLGLYNDGGSLPVPVREGYRFLGWATNKNGGSFITDESVYDKTEDSTLYAVWTEENAAITDFKVDTSGTDTTVILGEEYNPDGIRITVRYSDGTEITTTNGFTVSVADTSALGETPVIVVFDGQSTFFGITVLPKPDVVTGIKGIYSLPHKTKYVQGEKFNAEGLALEVMMESGKTKLVDTGIMLTGYDTDTPGIKNVTAEYEGFTIKFVITVEERTTVLRGDVNLDGDITAADATQILRHINGKTSAMTAKDVLKAVESTLAADTNRDGDVTAADATQILRFVNGKTSVLGN